MPSFFQWYMIEDFIIYRCVAAKGEGAPECDKFAKYYRALCPGDWVCFIKTSRALITFMFAV